jgi:Bacterial Ig-like domain (group 3)/Putative Ig domain/Galactose oxidase, central domain/Fibronectin type III domain/Kelch motif
MLHFSALLDKFISTYLIQCLHCQFARLILGDSIMRGFYSNVSSKSSSRRARRKPTTARLTVETMEERIVPSLTWSSGISLPYARTGDVAIKESDNSIIVLGGTTTVYQLGPTDTSWSAAASLSSSRTSPGVSLLSGGDLLVYGGSGLSSAISYDPTNASNATSLASMSTVHSLMAFATDGSNRAYAIGGLNGSGTRITTVERYDPSTGAWSTVAALPTALSGAVAVYDGAGDIFVFGGATNSSANSTTALKYSVASNSWSTVASMPSATTEGAAVMGPDGLIYVMGGMNSDGSQRSAVKVYNPSANSWSSGTSLPVPLSDEAAVVDAQNRIEVIGGTALGDDPYTSSAVYVTQTLANYAPIITTTSLPSATAGVAYSATVSAIGLPAPTFSVDSSPDTTGLTIDPSTGVISWTPSTSQIGTHLVTVHAENPLGTATKTFTLTVTTDITPPTAPTLTMATITSTSSIALNWTAATDNVGVAGYRLYQYTPGYWSGHSGKGGGLTWHPAVYTLLVNNIPPTTLTYTVTGLTPDTLYYFTVTAFDAAGNESAYSNIVSGTTWEVPSITWYWPVTNTYNPALSVVANHLLTFNVYTAGNPTPTLSMYSAPSGVSYSLNTITWTPTASQVGVNDIVMKATNSAGTTTLDIPVTVTADVPVPSLIVNGGYTYTTGNMTSESGTNDYLLTLNPAFGNNTTTAQFAMVGTAFSFQFAGTANTNPITYALVSGPSSMTINSSTGAGTWTPTASDSNVATSVTVSATNSAGTTLLTFTFPTYFTTAPTNVLVGFYASTSGASPTTYIPVVTWTAPANAAAVADYKVTVTAALTNTSTVYDTGSTATTFSLPLGITGQNWVNVTAYDANGGPSQTSTSNAPLYVGALTSLSWTPSSPSAVVGQPWSVQLSALYSPSFSILSAPAGATINSTTGLVSWTPTLAEVGTEQITAGANEGWGLVYTTLSIPVYAATTTTLTDNGPNPSTSGEAVSFTATVSGGPAINGETITIEDATSADAVVASPTLSNGTVTFTISDLTVGTHNLFAVYSGDATHLGSNDSTTPVTQVVNDDGTAPAWVSDVVNGGTPQYVDQQGLTLDISNQNSVVLQILVTFNEPVTLAPGAFSIVNNASAVTVNSGPMPNTAEVDLNAPIQVGDGHQWIVTFASSPGTHSNGYGAYIIDDGVYLLHIDHTKVQANAQTMAADNDTGFWALYGDTTYHHISGVDFNVGSGYVGDGYSDASVGSADFLGFKACYNSDSSDYYAPPNYNVKFDANLDGSVASSDFADFKANFNTEWVF